LPVDAVLPLEAVVLHAAVAFELTLRVAEVIRTADRKLTIEGGAEQVGVRRGAVALGPTHAIEADAGANTVGVASTERNRRIRVGECSRSAKAVRATHLGRFAAALVAAAETDAFDAVGREVGALTAIDAFAKHGLAETVFASRAARAVRVGSAEESTSVVGAREARSALEVVLTRVDERRAGVVDTEVAGVTVAVDEARADAFRSARVSEVALEAVATVPVGYALGRGGDVATAVRRVAVAADRAVAVGQADAEVERDALVERDVAEAIERAVEVADTGDLDDSVDGFFVPVDGAPREEEPEGQERCDA
jgi:hypothetical protein